jgi:hypothetical protein
LAAQVFGATGITDLVLPGHPNQNIQRDLAVNEKRIHYVPVVSARRRTMAFHPESRQINWLPSPAFNHKFI